MPWTYLCTALILLCLKSCCEYPGIHRAPAPITNDTIMLYLKSCCGYPGIYRTPAPITNSSCRAPAARGVLPVVLLAAGRGCVPTAAPSARIPGWQEQPSVPAFGTGSCTARHYLHCSWKVTVNWKEHSRPVPPSRHREKYLQARVTFVGKWHCLQVRLRIPFSFMIPA